MKRQYPSDSNLARHFYGTQPCKEFKLQMMYNNKIKDICVKASQTVTLTELDVTACGIGYEGAAAIAESLKGCKFDFRLKDLRFVL